MEWNNAPKRKPSPDPAGLKSSIVKALFGKSSSTLLPSPHQKADDRGIMAATKLSPLKKSLDLSLSEGDLTLTDEKTPVVRCKSQNMFFPNATDKSSASLQSLKDRTLSRLPRKLKETRKTEKISTNGKGPTAEQLSWLRSCRTGDVKKCKELLNSNPEILNYIPPYHSNYSAVHIATNGRHYNLLRLLKEKNANFNAMTKAGYTPLHLAAQNQDMETVRMLIHEFDVDPKIHDLMGYTYEHYADWLDYPDDDLTYQLLCRGAGSRASSRQPSIGSQESLASSKNSLSRHGSIRGTIRGFLQKSKNLRSRSPSLTQLTI
ncbi:unnamed protein product [Cylicocyclus nassatus]|uniref:Uncharacterized protein n=1 Tax=Cylicocyclus nassatus TaxID=53992 RepID=A0AA36M0M2_CYLNA|nr:unnamed protein product [Cylicocyclus nassatus]